MKLKVVLNKATGPYTKVTVQGDLEHPEVKNLLLCIEQFGDYISVKKNGANFHILLKDVYYVEALEHQCVVYTHKESYTTHLTLQQIETLYVNFIRVHKSFVINLSYVTFFKTTLNAKREATFLNGDRVEVSRFYVPKLLATLGVKK